MSLQRLWHLFGEIIVVVVVFGLPVVDLVELEEDAWLALLVTVAVLLCAVAELLEADFAVVFCIDAVITAAINAMIAYSCIIVES